MPLSIHCPLCNESEQAQIANVPGRGDRVSCPRCGTYTISEYALQQLSDVGMYPTMPEEKGFEYSSVARDFFERGFEFHISSLEDFEPYTWEHADPLKSIDRIIRFIYKNSYRADAVVIFDKKFDHTVAYTRNSMELIHVLRMAGSLGFLEHDNMASYLGWSLSPAGWQAARELVRQGSSSNQAFVAMWFDPTMDAAYHDGIFPALDLNGFDVFRVDSAEHNGKIDDLIIAEIRKSTLLVADFTGDRGGVYFEAGFALGLGIHVIWCCRNDDVDRLHFDTRQYNHIVWDTPEDLRDKLSNRIQATVRKAESV